MSAAFGQIAADGRVLEELAPLPPEPYPGLRAFEPGEWAIFFGREPMTDEVISRLLSRNVVVVHGSSGCGKSSLIRAGVLPWLQMEHARGGVAWKTAWMRPVDRPLRNFARALADSLGAPPDAASEQAVPAWHDRLVAGDWRKAIEDRLNAGAGQRLCLLIDQFEELFRYALEGARQEAQLFVDLLCNNAEQPISRLFLVLTMRSDYIGRCAEFDRFAEVVDRCQYLLPRMDSLALLRAIHEPARLFRGKIEAAVGDHLLIDARGQEDALPILQHTLMRACTHAKERAGRDEGWTVTTEDVVAVQGPSGSALSTHAEEVLDKLCAQDKQLLGTAEWVFRSLAEIDEARIVRRPCRLAEIVASAGGRPAEPRVLKVIEAFRARSCGYLMPPPGEELHADTMIDVGHEALLRQWAQLSDPRRDPATREPKGWLWREHEDGRRWQFLAMQAQDFAGDRRATLGSATTAVYERWWRSHNQAWAARYAREPKDADREYSEVQDLWRVSRRLAWRGRLLERLKLFFGGITALTILAAIGVYNFLDSNSEVFYGILGFAFLFAALLGVVYVVSFFFTFIRSIIRLWSRIYATITK